jgi:hypothetical protein
VLNGGEVDSKKVMQQCAQCAAQNGFTTTELSNCGVATCFEALHARMARSEHRLDTNSEEELLRLAFLCIAVAAAAAASRAGATGSTGTSKGGSVGRGDRIALNNLAICHARGIGHDKNRAMAIALFGSAILDHNDDIVTVCLCYFSVPALPLTLTLTLVFVHTSVQVNHLLHLIPLDRPAASVLFQRLLAGGRGNELPPVAVAILEWLTRISSSSSGSAVSPSALARAWTPEIVPRISMQFPAGLYEYVLCVEKWMIPYFCSFVCGRYAKYLRVSSDRKEEAVRLMEQYCAVEWLHPNACALLSDWYSEAQNSNRANYWLEIGASYDDLDCRRRLRAYV